MCRLLLQVVQVIVQMPVRSATSRWQQMTPCALDGCIRCMNCTHSIACAALHKLHAMNKMRMQLCCEHFHAVAMQMVADSLALLLALLPPAWLLHGNVYNTIAFLFYSVHLVYAMQRMQQRGYSSCITIMRFHAMESSAAVC